LSPRIVHIRAVAMQNGGVDAIALRERRCPLVDVRSKKVLLRGRLDLRDERLGLRLKSSAKIAAREQVVIAAGCHAPTVATGPHA
jgi:hypothetical protein